MSELDYDNPQYWHDLAEETRAKAGDMASAELQERMMVIAAEYDKLAEFVERRKAKYSAPVVAP
jgi:hypothetical protein